MPNVGKHHIDWILSLKPGHRLRCTRKGREYWTRFVAFIPQRGWVETKSESSGNRRPCGSTINSFIGNYYVANRDAKTDEPSSSDTVTESQDFHLIKLTAAAEKFAAALRLQEKHAESVVRVLYAHLHEVKRLADAVETLGRAWGTDGTAKKTEAPGCTDSRSGT